MLPWLAAIVLILIRGQNVPPAQGQELLSGPPIFADRGLVDGHDPRGFHIHNPAGAWIGFKEFTILFF